MQKSSYVAHRPVLIGVLDVIASKYIYYIQFISMYVPFWLYLSVLFGQSYSICVFVCRLGILLTVVWTSVLSYGNDIIVHVLCNDVIVHVVSDDVIVHVLCDDVIVYVLCIVLIF